MSYSNLNRTIALSVGVLAMVFLISYFALAWSEPTAPPPGDNVPAPLNISINAQAKEGALVLATNSGVPIGLIVQYGNVGIGTTTPSYKLDVVGDINVPSTGYLRIAGSIGSSGQVLTRTDTGMAWQNATSGGGGYWAALGQNIYNTNSGYVGIGTDTPNNLIQVRGLINFDNSLENTAMGYRTLSANTTGDDSVAIGYEALRDNTTGFKNTAVGNNALIFNQTGNDNVALGQGALLGNISGSYNTAVGQAALRVNTTAIYNTAVGNAALFQNTIGSQNTALGVNTLGSNKDGDFNTAVGIGALYKNISADNNTAMGFQALHENTTGGMNTAVGYLALNANTTGFQNTALGYMANVSSGSLTMATAIGSGAQVACSNCLVLGNTDTKIGIGTASPSTKLHVAGGVRITDLVSCDTIDTDASGNLICGTDETGSASGIGGSGTTNYLAKFTAGATIGNSQIYDNGTNVGIGTSNPSAKLEVAGQVKITGGSPGAGKVLTSDAAGLASWQTPSGGGGGVGSSVVEIYCEDLDATTRASCSANCPAGYRVMSCGGYGCSYGNEIRNYGSWPSDSDTCRCYTWGPTGITVSIMCWGLCIPL